MRSASCHSPAQQDAEASRWCKKKKTMQGIYEGLACSDLSESYWCASRKKGEVQGPGSKDKKIWLVQTTYPSCNCSRAVTLTKITVLLSAFWLSAFLLC
jgi:hypothetical protein